MRTITTYFYDELSPEAQKSAVENLRNRIGDSNYEIASDDYRACLDDIANQFNLNIYNWEIGMYCPYYFRFEIKDREMREVQESDSKYIIRYFENFIKPRLQHEVRVYWKNGKTRKSRIQTQYDCCITGCYTDYTIDKALNERYEYVRKGYSLREYLYEVLDNFFKSWQRELESCYSDEVIAEHISVNDFEFLEDGTPFNSLGY